MFYGVASTLYRLFILVTIVLFLAEEYLVAGVVLGAFAVLLQVVLPLTRQVRFAVRALEAAERLRDRQRPAGPAADHERFGVCAFRHGRYRYRQHPVPERKCQRRRVGDSGSGFDKL